MRIATLAKGIVMSAASLLALNAYAGLEITNATPMPGTVGTLSSVTIQLSGNSVTGSSTAATIVDSDNVSYACTTTYSRTNVTVTLAETISTPGTYTLSIAEGVISDQMTSETNDEIELEYTVTGETNAATFTWTTIDPAEGVVESLSTINIYRETTESIAAYDYDEQGATVTGPNGEIEYNKIAYSARGGYASLFLKSEITEPGEYTITVPQGWLKNTSSVGVSPELVLHYTIEEAVTLPVVAITEENINANPLPNNDPEEDPIYSLSQVQVTFFNTEELAIANKDAKAIVKDADGFQIGEGTVSVETVNAGRWSYTAAVIDFAKPITGEGAVTVTVPEGTFSGLYIDLEDENNDDPVEVLFGEMNLTYNLSALKDANVTATPADGSTLDSLVGTFDIAYNDCLTDGLYFANGAESVEATIKNADGDTVSAYTLEYGEKGHVTFEIPEDEAITEAGEYTISIPAGEVLSLASDEAYAGVELTYFVKDNTPVFVPEIDPEEGEVASLSLINITFTNATTVKLNDEAGPNDFPYLANLDGSKVARWMGYANGNVLTVKPYSEYTTAGNYIVVIPAGFYTIDGYTQTEDMYLEYTIVNSTPEAKFFCDYEFTNIEEEGTISELNTIDFKFIAVDSDWSPITEGITYKHDTYKNVTLQRFDDSYNIVETYGGTITGTDPELSWAPYYAVTDSGNYLFTVPEGYMTLTNEAGATVTSDEILFIFSLSYQSGVKTVNAVQLEKESIYTLQGVNVGTDLNKLPAGIYILNGRKVRR
jgi:methionine-rich copper-binding protein CopC